MNHSPYTILKPKSLTCSQPPSDSAVTSQAHLAPVSMGWSWNPPGHNSHDFSGFSFKPVLDTSPGSVSGELVPVRNSRILSESAEIHITCSCKSRKPKRLNSRKPKSVFSTRNSCSQLIISLPLKAVLDRSNQKLLQEGGYFNPAELCSTDSDITNVLTSTLAVGLKKLSVDGKISVGSTNHASRRTTWKVDSCVISHRSQANNNGALDATSDPNTWNNVTYVNPFRGGIHSRLGSRRAITSGRPAAISSENNNSGTGCIDLTDLSRVLESTLDDSSAENSDISGTAQSCASSVPDVTEDFSVEDLSGYFEDFCHIPKKMSLMAELMYA